MEQLSLVKSSQLVSIGLSECKFDVGEPVLGPGSLTVEVNMSSFFGINESLPTLNGRLVATIAGRTESDAKIFDLVVGFVSVYSLKQKRDWPKVEVDHFCERNMMLHFWPYLREFVDSLTGRSTVPRVVLPLVPFSLNKKEQSDAPSAEAVTK
jgi:hypothetical protein